MLTALNLHDPESSAEDALLSEALCRGAEHGDLVRLLAAYENQHPLLLSPAAVLGLDASISLRPDLIALHREYKIDKATRVYRLKVSTEYENLKNPDVKKSFSYGDTSKGKDTSFPLRYYSELRPAYYNSGYNQPYEMIFSKISAVEFLGQRVLLHEIAGSHLKAAGDALKRKDPNVVASFSKAIKPIGGFTPRFVAPRQGVKDPRVLSNHAFGLAIDIEGDFDPHIKDRDVIRVIKEITGVDFGTLLVAKNAPISGLQRSEETYRRAATASKLLQAWLQKYLPLRWSIMADAGGARGPDEQGRAFQVLTHSVTSLQSVSPVDDTAVELARLAVLEKFHGVNTVQHWMRHGILTLPIWLVIALIDNGLKWGAEEYESTKDLMHFELDWNFRNVLKPDSPRRSLSDLFNAPRGSAQKVFIENKRTKHLPR